MKRTRGVRTIAVQRIDRLLALAAEEAKKGKEKRSDRYVQLARNVGMRHRVRIPSDLRMWLCKGCHSFLIPGKSARVRLRKGYIMTTCLKCGMQMRRPYKAPRPPSRRGN